MEQKKDPIGKIALELVKTAGGEENYSLDRAREMLQRYDEHVLAAVKDGQKQYGGNFCVVVSVKKERLLNNVIRSYFYARQTCPHPVYDQTVYYFDAQKQTLDLLWVIPDKETCKWYRDHPLETTVDRRDLLMDVLSFYDGSLNIKQRQINSLLQEDSVSRIFADYHNDDVDNHTIIS